MQPGQPTVLESGAQSPPDALLPGTVVDRYEVLGLLGTGGMARVYRVRHRYLGSLHALKVLTLDRPSLRQRAIQEGRVQATLRHTHVVRVTDIVVCRGAPALVLEYVAGPALDQLLADRRLTLDEVDVLATGILRGVAFAHAHGVVHRDLKPGNILLEVAGRTLVPRVTDFGIAKLLLGPPGAMRTMAGTAMGTPPYMAPEQGLDASVVDARADVWALGVVLYELASGQSAVFDGLPEDPEAELLARGLPRRIARTVGTALRRRPSARPADARELLTLWTGGSGRVRGPGAVCSPATMAAAYALRPRVLDDTPDSTLRTAGHGAAWRGLLITGAAALMVGAMAVATVFHLVAARL